MKKLTHADFRTRVARVDPRFARMGHAAYARDATPAKPFGMALLGFGWFYLVVSVAYRRDHIAASLRQGSLPDEYHGWIMHGLAVLLAASMVMLCMHLMRYMSKTGGKRKNSGGILTGGMLALTLFNTPPGIWQMGFGMLDGNSQTAILTASAAFGDTIPGLQLDKIASVASNGH
ncbi:hypothetical protein [Sagittula salina]|uniref:Uncharacterized protein n=1 Tax=Sagittula salina TaxID=2820268 RepID=A0A940MTV6_9RHOB|nr:hypothetical protein [Sagittula salina]MBP0482864.1 hypothetical protein [Sagittula salina]